MESYKRPQLDQLKRTCPQDLSHCEGYVWHLGSRIGKGSFGGVFFGWNTAGTTEVAVKAVRKEFFKQDPKVRENLEREIKILKLLRLHTEHIVQLYHVQELESYVVLVLELCKYDLNHLIKIEPFNEDNTVLFLHQLAEGMKVLRKHNIVHRDLQPGNILIKHHPHTKKMQIKISDFGFARHFKDECMKPIDMHSMAGTPVFMAPEALRCVFHPGERYDDKVDVWSIGALLYKVIVGQCGFYAQLQDIPRILKHKGDAIAFERVPLSRKVNYICELPPSVNSRLSEPFRAKMNKLLQKMLKLDPIERMTFPQFFDEVDDMMKSKIEIVNLLHGTSHKIISDPNLIAEDIVTLTRMEYHLPPKSVVLFSNKSPFYITGQNSLTPEQFKELLNDAGLTEGYALLYLLPITQLSPDKFIPDYSNIALLKNELTDEDKFITLILEYKFSDEVVRMIKLVQLQQQRQLEGLKEFSTFCSRELIRCTSDVCCQLSEQGHVAMGKAMLAEQWLQKDIESLSSDHESQLQIYLNSLTLHKDQIGSLVAEGGNLGSTPVPNVSISFKPEDLDKKSAALVDDTKKLSNLTRDKVFEVGDRIREDCQKQIDEVTGEVRGQLCALFDHLKSIWGMREKLTDLQKHCDELDHLFTQIAQERSRVLKSLTFSNDEQDTVYVQSGPTVFASLPIVRRGRPPQAPPHTSIHHSNSQSGAIGREEFIRSEVPTLGQLQVLKYSDDGKMKRIRIISAARHKWKDIASLICDSANKTTELKEKHQNDPNDCLRDVFVNNFINKKPQDYSQDWSGLIELLNDVELETVAEEVEYALSCGALHH